MDVALFQPEIPPNTGNIARLCVCAATPLHIIGQPSFSMDERAVRRAGLDYWEHLTLHRHADWNDFLARMDESSRRILLISKHGAKDYWDCEFKADDVLVFGNETSGLPTAIHETIRARDPERILRIPMWGVERSLNLANAVSVVLYEALRQTRINDK